MSDLHHLRDTPTAAGLAPVVAPTDVQAAHDAEVRAEVAEQIARAIEAVDERAVLDRKDALLMCARIASEQGGER